MKLGVDIDGVCAQFCASMNELLAKHFKENPAPVRRWNWFEEYGPEGESIYRELMLKAGGESNMFVQELKPEPYAFDTLHVLAQRHEIAFVTARHPSWEKKTQSWLKAKTYDLFPFELHLTQLKHQVPCDLYVDDNELILKSLLDKTDARVVAFAQPWNVGWLYGKEGTALLREHADRFDWVSGWQEFLTRIAPTLEPTVFSGVVERGD